MAKMPKSQNLTPEERKAVDELADRISKHEGSPKEIADIEKDEMENVQTAAKQEGYKVPGDPGYVKELEDQGKPVRQMAKELGVPLSHIDPNEE